MAMRCRCITVHQRENGEVSPHLGQVPDITEILSRGPTLHESCHHKGLLSPAPW